MIDDNVKRRAANIVLSRLGEEMLGVLAHHLRRSYAITLAPNDNSNFSLDQLHFGLAVLLGEGHANILLAEISKEIKELTQAQAQ